MQILCRDGIAAEINQLRGGAAAGAPPRRRPEGGRAILVPSRMPPFGADNRRAVAQARD
jgi:hypothetical protein